jgi:hypothetical protein
MHLISVKILHVTHSNKIQNYQIKLILIQIKWERDIIRLKLTKQEVVDGSLLMLFILNLWWNDIV